MSVEALPAGTAGFLSWNQKSRRLRERADSHRDCAGRLIHHSVNPNRYIQAWSTVIANVPQRNDSSSLFSEIIHSVFKKITVSPSKTYLWSQFYRDLKSYSDVDRAADIASSHFKNAPGFNADHYVGVDIDLERLRDGRAEINDTRSHSAVRADIRETNFRPQSFDLIASTHTIHHFSSEEHIPFLETLIEYLSTGGNLFIEFQPGDFNKEIESLLRANFESVDIVKYSNPISRAFNAVREQTNWLPSFDMDSWKRYPQVAIVLAITLFEFLPLPGRDRRYVRCISKR